MDKGGDVCCEVWSHSVCLATRYNMMTTSTRFPYGLIQISRDFGAVFFFSPLALHIHTFFWFFRLFRRFNCPRKNECKNTRKRPRHTGRRYFKAKFLFKVGTKNGGCFLNFALFFAAKFFYQTYIKFYNNIILVKIICYFMFSHTNDGKVKLIGSIVNFVLFNS